MAEKKNVANYYFWIDSGIALIAGGSETAVSKKAAAGDLVGTFAVHDIVSFYSADAVAETELWVYAITSSDMKEFLLNNPEPTPISQLNKPFFI